VHVTSTLDKKCLEMVVVVDVLRSSSTIVTALNNQASAVVPFVSIEKAIKFRNAERRDHVILVGERDGITPKLFDYNISPFDMTRKNIGGKIIAFSSTNLTRIIDKIRKSKIIVGCIINAKATADYLTSEDRDVAIVACGTREGPTVEDLAGAGTIASYMRNAEFSDEALAAIGLCKASDWRNLIRRGRTAKRLVSLGYERDINFCTSVNSSLVVACVAGNEIVNARDLK